MYRENLIYKIKESKTSWSNLTTSHSRVSNCCRTNSSVAAAKDLNSYLHSLSLDSLGSSRSNLEGISGVSRWCLIVEQ